MSSSGVLIVAATRCSEALRRRVFLVVLVLTVAFVGAVRAGAATSCSRTSAASRTTRSGLDTKTLAGATIFGLAMFGDAVPGHRAGDVPDRSARCAATPSGGCCSRSSSARSAARSTSLGRFLAAARRQRRLRAGRLLRRRARSPALVGDWWPDAPVGAGLRLAGGAVARRRALAAGLGVPRRPPPTGSPCSWSTAPGLLAGLLGAIGDAIRSHTLQDIAERVVLDAAVRGALPRRAAAARRRTCPA